AASVGRLALMWMESRVAARARVPAAPGRVAAAFERARRELAREERRAVVIEFPVPERAGGRADDERVGETDGGVAVSEHGGGGGVSEVPVGVGDPERGGAGSAAAERDRGAGGAAVQEGGAGALCEGEGAA